MAMAMAPTSVMGTMNPLPGNSNTTTDNGNALTIGTKDKSVRWWLKDFPGTNPEARKLLEEYAGIPADKVDDWALAMRDKAWDVFPYPCIGGVRFLNLTLHHHPAYASLLHRLKDPISDTRYLDIGFCLGQDLRQLAADGALRSKLFGAELQPAFIELGYDFFRDRGTLQATLMQADILDLDDGPLGKLRGSFDFVHLALVMHLFAWEQQREVLGNCLRLLKPKAGGQIVGRAAGDQSIEGGKGWATSSGGRAHRHSVETFQNLCAEVEAESQVRLQCEAWMEEGQQSGGMENVAFRHFVFEITRLE